MAPAFFHLRIRRAGGAHSDFAQVCMLDDGVPGSFRPGRGAVVCRIEQPRLAPGPYELRCAIRRTATMLAGQADYQDLFLAGTFFVEGSPREVGLPGLLETFAAHPGHAPVLLEHAWSGDGVERGSRTSHGSGATHD